MSEESWNNAANTIISAGQIPLPVNDTMLELQEKYKFIIQLAESGLAVDKLSRSIFQLGRCLLKSLSLLNTDHLQNS